ncbi:hypothetical protein CLW00_103153 [Mongoliibacter ruber]|uniref:Uncharacterized protein n=1 Tax=Mongoliibacter ruber TaxID=1750599 RepID=A0A2T0WQP2_9BACT|nr:hypothetical protein CLW00_103153 [Mongoliibacter ruber]
MLLILESEHKLPEIKVFENLYSLVYLFFILKYSAKSNGITLQLGNVQKRK